MINKEYPYKVESELLELQEVTSTPRVVIGEADVKKYMQAEVHIRFGRLTTSAFTAGVNFRIETSPEAAGNLWNPVTEFTSQLGSSVATEAVNGTCAAGQKVIPMASTTGFVAGDKIYTDNTTPANSEFGRVKTISGNTSITQEDNLVNAQTGSTVFDQAEIYAPVQVDVSAALRLRVVADGSGTGQNFATQAIAILTH